MTMASLNTPTQVARHAAGPPDGPGPLSRDGPRRSLSGARFSIARAARNCRRDSARIARVSAEYACAYQKVNLPADQHTPGRDLNAVDGVDPCSGWQMLKAL